MHMQIQVQIIGQDVIYIQVVLLLLVFRYGIRQREFQIIIHLGDSSLYQPSEEPWKDQRIVDLIFEIGSAGTDYKSISFFGLVWVDFRDGVGQSHDDGFIIHGLYVGFWEAVALGNPDKDIGIFDDLF